MDASLFIEKDFGVVAVSPESIETVFLEDDKNIEGRLESANNVSDICSCQPGMLLGLLKEIGRINDFLNICIRKSKWRPEA